MGWTSVGSHIYTFDLEEMSAIRENVVQSENSVRPRKVVARKDWNAALFKVSFVLMRFPLFMPPPHRPTASSSPCLGQHQHCV